MGNHALAKDHKLPRTADQDYIDTLAWVYNTQVGADCYYLDQTTGEKWRNANQMATQLGVNTGATSLFLKSPKRPPVVKIEGIVKTMRGNYLVKLYPHTVYEALKAYRDDKLCDPTSKVLVQKGNKKLPLAVTDRIELDVKHVPVRLGQQKPPSERFIAGWVIPGYKDIHGVIYVGCGQVADLLDIEELTVQSTLKAITGDRVRYYVYDTHDREDYFVFFQSHLRYVIAHFALLGNPKAIKYHNDAKGVFASYPQ